MGESIFYPMTMCKKCLSQFTGDVFICLSCGAQGDDLTVGKREVTRKDGKVIVDTTFSFYLIARKEEQE